MRLASDIQALAAMRASLRDSMHEHSLTDGARLAREIETAYRWMWRRWLAESASYTTAARTS